ncbi:MAG: hypothetical protein GY945_12945, partial [Rhodobacteraceae bacterium]|nr:hypothetical protein [Paracoccaceae bacterium]
MFDDDGKRYVEGLSGLQYAHNAFDVPIKNILHTDCPHYYHYGEDGESEEDYVSRLAANLEDLIQSEGPDTIAAFIAEPILEAHDDPDALSVAFQIAQGRDVPMHMWVMSFTVREFLKRIPKGRASPGDMWFLALPKVG